jgi:predicted N-acyltransferase
MAKRGERYIAGALNLLGDDCIYGRNWGAVEEVPFLHFELCYYQAIEHAIRLGLPRVEAGAQGQHKIARGYLPAPVYSAHFIADPALREPVRRYLDQERAAVQNEMDWLAEEYSPFKATP